MRQIYRFMYSNSYRVRGKAFRKSSSSKCNKIHRAHRYLINPCATDADAKKGEQPPPSAAIPSKVSPTEEPEALAVVPAAAVEAPIGNGHAEAEADTALIAAESQGAADLAQVRMTGGCYTLLVAM